MNMEESNLLESKALDVIADVFNTDPESVTDIAVLKKGMTNRSFLFCVNREKYIIRIPGEGTDRLIDRAQEAEVFRAISGLALCDDPLYINPDNGYKITKYLENARTCDAEDLSDVKKCMAKLRELHERKISVPHTFDIFGQIDFYEALWEGKPSVYKDYRQTKMSVMGLKPYIDAQPKERCLTHIDAVSDNFLFYTLPDGREGLQLTDWEYAGMQDPHVDIAMFCIYSLYDRQQVDDLIDIYFEGKCEPRIRTKIYCYIAVCGLLWSNWAEYKRKLGIEFGEYSFRQYGYARDYCRYAAKEMGMAQSAKGNAEGIYTAKRAIILAAGIGKRMQPLSFETPKPLVRVNGKRIIDTAIEGLHVHGISEIYVVVGHRKEQFASLPAEYPGLTLIENPYFDTCNNISSLYAAREHLGESLILDGDQIIYNPEVLDPHFTLSGYNAVWTECETKEWLMEVEDGVVKSCSRTGGKRGWQLYSISRWTQADGERLRGHVEAEFENGSRQLYWDDVVMFRYFDQYVLGIREMKSADVIEIDSLDELAVIDKKYKEIAEKAKGRKNEEENRR